MSIKIVNISVILILLLPANANAAFVNGKIKSIQVNMAADLIIIELEGQPIFDGGNCQHNKAVAQTDNQEFLTTIYPLLLAAHATGHAVAIDVVGCIGNFPVISAAINEPIDQ